MSAQSAIPDQAGAHKCSMISTLPLCHTLGITRSSWEPSRLLPETHGQKDE